jgi:hypothetical protein
MTLTSTDVKRKTEEYIARHGDDLPAIANWRWGSRGSVGARATSTEGDNV